MSKYENPRTESSLFKTKTLEEIEADIKEAFEFINKPSIMSREMFNTLTQEQQRLMLWLAKNSPGRFKIEGEIE